MTKAQAHHDEPAPPAQPKHRYLRTGCSTCGAPIVLDLGPADQNIGLRPVGFCTRCRFEQLGMRCVRIVKRAMDAESPEGLATIVRAADEFRSKGEPVFRAIAGAIDQLADRIRRDGFAEQGTVGLFSLGSVAQSVNSFLAMQKAGLNMADLWEFIRRHASGECGNLGTAIGLELTDQQLAGRLQLTTAEENTRTVATGKGVVESQYTMPPPPQALPQTLQIMTLLEPDRDPKAQTIIRLLNE